MKGRKEKEKEGKDERAFTASFADDTRSGGDLDFAGIHRTGGSPAKSVTVSPVIQRFLHSFTEK